MFLDVNVITPVPLIQRTFVTMPTPRVTSYQIRKIMYRGIETSLLHIVTVVVHFLPLLRVYDEVIWQISHGFDSLMQPACLEGLLKELEKCGHSHWERFSRGLKG